MTASGFAGLGEQIVWTEQFGLWLGHDVTAVLAVVAAFFGGLGLGAWALAGRIQRSPRPARWYAGCEALIGGWALLLAALLPGANALLAAWTGPQPSVAWQWTVAFIGPFLLLLPATFAMGATLPAIERVTARLKGEGHRIGALYAANTLGAVAGTLASAFCLVPTLGLTRTALACAVLNGLCALVAWWRFDSEERMERAAARTAPVRTELVEVSEPSTRGLRQAQPERVAGAVNLAAPPQSVRTEPVEVPAPSGMTGATNIGETAGLLATLAATGLLGIGYEVVVVRVLSQVAQDTVYTFALLLAAYLAGTAAGAALYQRRLAGRHPPEALRGGLLCALAAACLAGSASLWISDTLLAALTQTLGGGVTAALTAEAAIALAAFALPTLVMGALFSHLCTEVQAAGRSLGLALGVNTAGAALAPLLCGVLLLPAIGPKGVLLLIAIGYLLLVPRPRWTQPRLWAPAAAAAGLALFTGPLAFVDLPEGGRLLRYQDGVAASVSVVEDAQGVARLRINNRQQEGSSASLATDARLAWLPLLLHPAPHDALFLGLGTGLTAGSAALDASLAVDAVELLPEVIDSSAAFADALDAPASSPKPHLQAGDARRHVRTTERRYDVIVADLFHPARSGAGALYTVEHFAALRERLRGGGVFCQWLPLHQLDLATLRSIVRSYLAVYPDAIALLASNSLETPVIGLVAHADGARFDTAALRQRMARAALPERRAQWQLADEFAALGSLVAGPRALARWSADAPLNTDDRPVVAHRAPFITYAPDTLPRQRLATLLHELQAGTTPDDLAGDPLDPTWQRRLAAYRDARNRFLDAGMAVQPNADPRVMLAQVREPLLDIVRRSPDFRPAYDPLLRLAMALAATDPPAARRLLTDLASANPARPDAARALARLTDSPSP